MRTHPPLTLRLLRGRAARDHRPRLPPLSASCIWCLLLDGTRARSTPDSTPATLAPGTAHERANFCNYIVERTSPPSSLSHHSTLSPALPTPCTGNSLPSFLLTLFRHNDDRCFFLAVFPSISFSLLAYRSTLLIFFDDVRKVCYKVVVFFSFPSKIVMNNTIHLPRFTKLSLIIDNKNPSIMFLWHSSWIMWFFVAFLSKFISSQLHAFCWRTCLVTIAAPPFFFILKNNIHHRRCWNYELLCVFILIHLI